MAAPALAGVGGRPGAPSREPAAKPMEPGGFCHGIGGGSCTLWFDMRYLLFALAACSGTASDPVGKPVANVAPARHVDLPSVTSLIWNLEPTGDRLGPTSVSWVDAAGTVVWTKPIPKGLRFSVSDDANTRPWLMKQRADDGYAKYWAVAALDGAIALEDEGDLIVLDVGDGHTRFAWTDPRDYSERGDTFSEALFDSGDVDITGPSGARCTLHVAQKQNFLVACDGALIYYDRGILAAFDLATGHMIAKEDWHGPRDRDLKGTCPGELRATFDQTRSVGGWKVRARGERFTSCMT